MGEVQLFHRNTRWHEFGYDADRYCAALEQLVSQRILEQCAVGLPSHSDKLHTPIYSLVDDVYLRYVEDLLRPSGMPNPLLRLPSSVQHWIVPERRIAQ